MCNLLYNNYILVNSLTTTRALGSVSWPTPGVWSPQQAWYVCVALSPYLHTSALGEWGDRKQGVVVSKQAAPQVFKVEGVAALLGKPGLLVFLRHRPMSRICQKSKGI